MQHLFYTSWLRAGSVILMLAVAGLVGTRSRGADTLPFLHPMFGDHAVLQRNIPDPVWGWTTPGVKVTVAVDNAKPCATLAGADGRWQVKIGPFHAGGPHTLTIIGPQTVTLQDILFGDVWICSGQSNMQFGVNGALNAPAEIAGAANPQIRLFTVGSTIALEPRPLVQGSWSLCTPETIPGFSAVGYFFGRALQQSQHIPIGLINSSWGGTIAEAWTSGDGLSTMPDFKPSVDRMREVAAMMKRGDYSLEREMQSWYAKNDPGSATEPGWADPAFDAQAWKTMTLPTLWEVAGLPDFDGIVWFRKEVTLPAEWSGKELVLHLGPIDDRDTTWFNGINVGHMDQWNLDRVYTIPAKLVQAGRAVLTVRVLDTGGGGGIYGQAAQMRLECKDDATKTISLAGPWTYQAGTPLAQLQSPAPTGIDQNPNVATVLYNGMIAPLTPYAIKGAIWYQGESNADRPKQYQTLLPTLITDWRAHFGVGDFPFFVVSLANFLSVQTQPAESGWAELREAQWLATRRVRNAELALAIDIGDAGDIHPKNKQEVGRRLALAARATVYKEKLEYSGPVYGKMKVQGKSIHLTFSHLGGGLVCKDGDKLQGFAIAGKDKAFKWADAVIDGNSIIVSSPDVAAPLAVRYNWANNPIGNLYNRAGLPAVPFRTDM